MHAQVGDNLLISPRPEASSLSENSIKLPFAAARVVPQARTFVQARAVSPKRESLT